MEWEDFSQRVITKKEKGGEQYLNGGLEARSQDTEKGVTQKKKENKETEKKRKQGER